MIGILSNNRVRTKMNRTRKGWESYCISHIKENGNQFSVFWATDNKFVSNAMQRLTSTNRIIVTPLEFPVSKVRFNKNRNTMKRFKIEVQKNGVAVWDRVNKFYVIDASTIQNDLSFTLCKRGVKHKKQFKWEEQIIYKIKDVSQKDL